MVFKNQNRQCHFITWGVCVKYRAQGLANHGPYWSVLSVLLLRCHSRLSSWDRGHLPFKAASVASRAFHREAEQSVLKGVGYSRAIRGSCTVLSMVFRKVGWGPCDFTLSLSAQLTCTCKPWLWPHTLTLGLLFSLNGLTPTSARVNCFYAFSFHPGAMYDPHKT